MLEYVICAKCHQWKHARYNETAFKERVEGDIRGLVLTIVEVHPNCLASYLMGFWTNCFELLLRALGGSNSLLFTFFRQQATSTMMARLKAGRKTGCAKKIRGSIQLTKFFQVLPKRTPLHDNHHHNDRLWSHLSKDFWRADVHNCVRLGQNNFYIWLDF